MYVCGFPDLTFPAKKYRSYTFFYENLQKIIEDFLKNFYVSLGTTTFCIRQLKSQRFASSAAFNVIEIA